MASGKMLRWTKEKHKENSDEWRTNLAVRTVAEVLRHRMKRIIISASHLKNGLVTSRSAFFNWIQLTEPSWELQVSKCFRLRYSCLYPTPGFCWLAHNQWARSTEVNKGTVNSLFDPNRNVFACDRRSRLQRIALCVKRLAAIFSTTKKDIGICSISEFFCFIRLVWCSLFRHEIRCGRFLFLIGWFTFSSWGGTWKPLVRKPKPDVERCRCCQCSSSFPRSPSLTAFRSRRWKS